MLFLILAWETLGNPVKRRSYDSVDPQFNDSVPSVNSNSKENFFEVFRPVFAENARYVLTGSALKIFMVFTLISKLQILKET